MTRSLFVCAKLSLAMVTLLVCSLSSLMIPVCLAQDSNELSDRERMTADRYLQVLLRRPRPGVALDRVYGYHVQNDSLDQLQQQLTADPDSDDAGQRQMIWGLIQLQRGRSADAATILSAAESKLEQDAACSFYLGRAYLAVGQTEKAAAAMERAIERGPARAEALPMFTELGRIYSRAGENEKSLSVWTRLEKLFPGDTRVGGQIARTLAEEGNFTDAKSRYEQLSKTARKPDDKIAFSVQAAEMRRRTGESDEAMLDLERILARLRPGSWLYTDVRNRIEAGFLRSGDYDALAEYYKKQLAGRPDDLALQTRLSRIMITAGRLEEAKALLESAIESAPDDADARLTLIDVLVNQNNVAGAANQFKELAKRDSKNPDYLIRWGQVLLDDSETPLEERRNAAAKIWSQLAQDRSDDAVTLSQIADLMRGIDRSDDAIKFYRQSIEIDPGSPQYREYLGEYLHSLDRTEDAIEVWASIAGEDRRGRESLVRLAEVFGTFKKADLALDAWKQASEFDLTFAQELRYAAKLADAKQYDDAITRLDLAENIAETPDEQEKLLKERISVYQSSGTLEQQIQQVASEPESVTTLRKLALMYGASGDLTNGQRSIQKALAIEPDNTDVLMVAADLAERQNQFGDAADLFGRLAAADSRFRTNYLQRVASLQIRLGKIDQAMKTCEAIIDANPASPESYQFYARTAFGVNRDEVAITALRRAMTVAPRDNSPRRMLASHYADRFRTDKAVELYWQAFTYEPKTDDKINLIRALAPLYDRKADLETLIGRIEEINRKDGNARTMNLMVAAAHESVEDFGAARQAIDQLIAVQPRDVALLETMVRLSDAADEVELAAEYQQRITELANTPENRFKLVQYQLDAGTIDVAQALSQRLSFLSDPSRLGAMVRSAVRRGDLKTARAICKEALRGDESLWDIKLAQAQLLLMDRDDEQAKENRELAIELAQEVRAVGLPMDAPAPTRRKKTARSKTSNGIPANYLSNPLYWSQSSYRLAQMLRVGRYANSRYSSSLSATVVEPSSYGHARVIAASLILMNEAIDKTGNEAVEAIQAKLDSDFALPDLEKVTEPIELWEQQGLMSVLSVVGLNSSFNPFAGTQPGLSASAKAKAAEQRKKSMVILWRLAELDPTYGIMPLFQVLAQRMASDSLQGQQKPDMTPLTDDELQLLVKINQRIQESGFPSSALMGAPSGAAEMMFQAIVGNEFQLAGQQERAAEFGPKDLDSDASYAKVTGAIQFYLRLDKVTKADELVPFLVPAARREKQNVAAQGFNRSVQMMASGNEAAADFNRRHQKQLIDAEIARWSRTNSNTVKRSATLGDGYVNTYSLVGNSMRSVRVRAPLSTRLLDSSLAQAVLAFATPPTETSQNRQVTKVELPIDLMKYLEKPLPDAPADEQKTRAVVAAYAHWWAKRPKQCYEILVDLCQQYPSDVDLQIERARLASELNQPRLALEALDSFNPLDSRMLVRKEMAAMNLAAEIGDTDRAKVAAERLFGMRLDVKVQLALADQLKRLGLKSQSTAILQRTRSGRTRDQNTELQIARAFLSAGDKTTAAEVAYSMLRRMSSGRSTNNNNSHYQQQAVSILKSAGRLDPLIERAKRRVDSSPKAIRPKQELADLYIAAGRPEDANKLWETLSKDAPVTAPQLISRADALVKAKKTKEAVDMYLDAFEKDPSRFNNDFYKMVNAVRVAGDEVADKMFERLMTFPVDKIPTHRMDELARIGSRNELSDAKRKFIGRLLKSPAAQSRVHGIVRGLPDDQRAQIPEYRDALLRSVCSNDAFLFTSALWNVQSRGSGGTAMGPLADIMKLLQSDSDAEKTFRKAATEAFDDDSKEATAKFLVALLETNQNDRLKESLRTMGQCIKRDPDESSPSGRVSSGLLWQSGQLLESVDDVPIAFLIELYVEAKQFDATNSSSPQYTLNARLVDTYIKAKRFDEARTLLLSLYRDTDFSSQNQNNPGYGDYQQLQTAQWVAEKLADSKAPIDSLILYQSGLSDPAAFERAKRWGGGSRMKDAFEAGAKAAVKKITPEVAAAHLVRQIKIWEDDLDANPIELMESPPQGIMNLEAPSSIAMAIRVAVSEEQTRKQVDDFAARVEKLGASSPTSWRLAALSLMTACYLDGEQTDRLEKTLFDQLPDPADIAKPGQQVSDSLQYQDLLDLYPVARAASESQRESNQEIGKRLVIYIGKVAESANDSSIALALAQISGDASQSISRILEVIESRVQPGTALPEPLVKQCLQVATDAAKTDDIDTSTRALKLALSSGPPLRKLSTGGDAFAIAKSTSSGFNPYGGSSRQKLDSLHAQVSTVTQSLSDATGIMLQFEKNTYDKQQTPKVDRDTISQIADAYLAIVIPDSRAGQVFPYSTEIATTSYDRLGSGQQIVVDSASMALAIAAKHGDRKDLVAVLQSRIKSTADKTELSIALVQLTFALGQPDQINDALTQFANTVDGQLPKRDATSASTSPSASITSMMMTDSQKKSEIVNLVLHAIWPIAASDYLKDLRAENHVLEPQISAKVRSLLARTNQLIRSDSYTSNRHREIQRRISAKYVELAIESGDQKVVDEYIQSELQSIDTQSYPIGTDIEDYKRQSLERLTLQMIDDGLISQMDQIFRQLLTTQPKAKRDYSSRFEPNVCLMISQMATDNQLELLGNLTFGSTGKEPLKYFEGLVSFEVPPAIVRRQHPMLDATIALPTSNVDYPIVNSLLMLIDAVSASGDTDALREKLEAQTKAVGDEADIALALLRLAIADSDQPAQEIALKEIQPTLKAVEVALKKNLPKKNSDELVFPALEFHLVIRAFDAGLLRNIAEPLIKNIKPYAVRGQRNYLVSAVARVTSKMGVGRAAGATVDSPLEHFNVVSLAARVRSDNVRLMPLFAVDGSGWISGTSGYDQTYLMFKYPLSGTFRFSATIQDGAWGESDLAYGGVIYQANGWQKTASITGMGNRGMIKFDVPSIQQGKINVESISVSSDGVSAGCNGEDYVSDIATGSFPFASVFHHKYRTTQFRDVKFTGNPTIPDEVNLIDPTMRGWGILTRGRTIPQMLLPIGPKQDATKIKRERAKVKKTLSEGPLVGSWSVTGDGLHYSSQPQTARTYDPASHLQYLRPIQDGESIAIEFFWKQDKTEFSPTIGRTILHLTGEGIKPDWISVAGDLASVGFVAADKLDPPVELLAPQNVPIDNSWNQLLIKRAGDVVELTLNEKPLVKIPVAGHERPGIYRHEKLDVHLRSMRLTGDWPDQVPKELIANE